METLAARGEARSQQDFLDAVRREIIAILSGGRADTALRFNFDGGPTVLLIAGWDDAELPAAAPETKLPQLVHALVARARSLDVSSASKARAI